MDIRIQCRYRGMPPPDFTWPKQCICCGDPATTNISIRSKRAYFTDLTWFTFLLNSRRVESLYDVVKAPVCGGCRRHLSVSLGLLIRLALILSFVILPWAVRSFIDLRSHSVWVELALFSLPVWLALAYGLHHGRPKSPSCAGRTAFVFSSSNEEIRLSFRNARYGELFAAANEEWIRNSGAVSGSAPEAQRSNSVSAG